MPRPELNINNYLSKVIKITFTWKGVEPELENKQNKTNRVKVNSKSK